MLKNDYLSQYFNHLPISLDKSQEKEFHQFYELLIAWSKVMNLTNILAEKDVYIKHFYDSLTLSKAFNFDCQSVLDLGRGAGFPGIPLKIAFPNLKITLVEPTLKRINFLKEVISQLSMQDITCLPKRAEDLLDFKETFDIVTSRAVASLPILLELAIPLLKIDGYLLVMKGSNINQELQNAKKAIDVLGCKIEEIFTFELPEEFGMRNIIKIKKIKRTDEKYPRPYAQIKRKTL